MESDTKYLPENFNEEEMLNEFEESYEILCKTNESFSEKMKKIYEYKGITQRKFVELTCLHRIMYKRFIEENYMPSMSAFMAMCMGLNLDFPTAESLLAALRLRFDKRNKLDCAYMFLLTHYQGLCIEDCNIILKKLGFNEPKQLLGTFDKEERKEKIKKNEL